MKTGKSILVLGDVMLDAYIFGDTNRLSPEAPCPILENCKQPNFYLGGASNVAVQIKASGFDVNLIGVVSDDNEGRIILKLIQKNGINQHLIIKKQGRTTLKTRYVTSGNRQLLRIDRDTTTKLIPEDYDDILGQIKFSTYCAVVISDYEKGFLTESFCKTIISKCKLSRVPVIVDIKNTFDKYSGATILKGNRKEFENIFRELNLVDSMLSMEYKLQQVSETLKCEQVIMTDGENGIHGFSRKESYIHVPSSKVPVIDVTGAGDIVTAFVALLTAASNCSFRTILECSNKASEKKISQFPKIPVTLGEIYGSSKLVSIEQLKDLRLNKKLVFTNGCFDVIHAGHISILEKAKKEGEILVVALNTDDSIKRLKGMQRPYNVLHDRISVISALSCVDYILTFDEDTPLSLIEELKPEILIKGGDYDISEIVGANLVKSYHGEVKVFSLYNNLSSTNLINRLTHG